MIKQLICLIGMCWIFSGGSLAAYEAVAPTNRLCLQLERSGMLMPAKLQTAAWGMVASSNLADKAQMLTLTNQTAALRLVWHARHRQLCGTGTVRANEINQIVLSATERFADELPVTAVLTMLNGYDLTIASGEGLVARPDDGYAHANDAAAPTTILYAPVVTNGCTMLQFVSGSSGTLRWCLKWPPSVGIK